MIVIRCPSCQGASRVEPEAAGLLVQCPRCFDPFVAIEDAPPLPPPPPPPPRPKLIVPNPKRIRPPRDRAEPVAPRSHPHGDPHEPSDLAAGALPLSVMIGLALLPFIIPLLWLAGPVITGHRPALTLATPAALAVSASVLCLAIVFTIDWSPATRLKGVLMLVGLSYLLGLSLFYLKKDMVDELRGLFSPDRSWKEFRPAGGGYRVKMPRNPQPSRERPLPGWNLTYHRASEEAFGAETRIEFVVGAGADDADVPQDPDGWADAAEEALIDGSGGTVALWRKVEGEGTAWEWSIRLPDRETTRVVHLSRVEGRVYYLAVEGPALHPDDEFPRAFFDSFQLTNQE